MKCCLNAAPKFCQGVVGCEREATVVVIERRSAEAQAMGVPAETRLPACYQCAAVFMGKEPHYRVVSYN